MELFSRSTFSVAYAYATFLLSIHVLFILYLASTTVHIAAAFLKDEDDAKQPVEWIFVLAESMDRVQIQHTATAARVASPFVRHSIGIRVSIHDIYASLLEQVTEL